MNIQQLKDLPSDSTASTKKKNKKKNKKQKENEAQQGSSNQDNSLPTSAQDIKAASTTSL